MSKHFWMGNLINDGQLRDRMASIEADIESELAQNISWDQLLVSFERFAKEITTSTELKQELLNSGLSEAEATMTLEQISDFLKREQILKKWKRELGTDQAPFDLNRISNSRDLFEAWKPLGVLTHIMPGNALGLSLLATIEGLLSGNLNIVKLSSRESDFSIKAFELLNKVDSDIAKRIIVLKISSKDEAIMDKILSISDGVSAWGGDSTIASIRNKLPTQTRLIPWGHKISLAYVSQQGITNESQLHKLAFDVVNNEQQACSSPQTILVETNNWEELKRFSLKFSEFLNFESSKIDQSELSIQEQAEITNQSALAKLEEFYGETLLIESQDRRARIIVENKKGIRPSPLYRTIIVRPINRNDIVSNLMSWRNYLQTACVVSSDSEKMEICDLLFKAGVTRITLAGQMLESYEGEPHDGVYALPRFMKRIRLELENASGISRPESMLRESKPIKIDAPVMTKADFQKSAGHESVAKYYFKSGGSTGKAALSMFSYRDYDHQMQAAAEGLLAAGLRPETDRAMNLFFGGGLYGGLLSFTTILEKCDAVQFPMAAHEDLNFVGDIIIEKRVNTILGMPSYIIQLLQNNVEKFKKSRVLEKIFYGGEHFSSAQRDWIQAEFGIKFIKSASYGSVDAGPLGYQCEFSEGGIHHLNDQLHILEILNTEKDAPVEKDEVGRLVFTTKHRDAIDIIRYEIGDLGKWVNEECRCGRKTPRFELMGRMGDVIRCAGTYINLIKLEKILNEICGYNGEVQVVIDNKDMKDHLMLKLDEHFQKNTSPMRQQIFESYKDLEEVVVKEKSLIFDISFIRNHDFLRTPGSGKLKRVTDLRNRS